MKKSVVSLTALLLVVAMMLSLVGCGGDTGGSGGSGGGTSSSGSPGSSSSSGGSESSGDAASGSSVEDPYFAGELADGFTITSRQSKFGDIYEYTTSTGTYEKKTPKDTIIIGGSKQATSADPHTQVVEYPWTYNVYESLLMTNPETGEIEPCLATEYYYDDDGLLHFILREGVKFHDGNTMTAEDVMFSIQRAANAPRDRARDILKYIDFEKSYIEDDYHVAFAFTEPCGAIIPWMSSQATAIMSKAFVEEVGPDYDYLSGDAGTGAYYLVDTVTDLSQDFERFDDYWGGKAHIKHITYKRYHDFTAMMIDYENGELDYTFANTPEATMSVVHGEVEDTVLSIVPSVQTCYLYMCQLGDVTPFTDIRIRQALVYAIDVQGLIDANYGAAGAKIALSCFGPGMDGYIDVGEYEYNPEKAKELLAECGYSTENPCTFKAAVSSSIGKDKDMEIIQAYLNEVGFDMQLDLLKTAQLSEVNNSKEVPSEYQLIFGFGGIGCGDVFEMWVGMLAGNGHAIDSASRAIPDDDWCRAIDNATLATDVAERTAYLQEAQQIAYDKVLTYPMMCYSSYVMYRPYLSGIRNTSALLTYWKDMMVTE